MTEEELHELMRRAGPGYGPTREPRYDEMWKGIEARAFGPQVLPLARRRWPRLLALAATLVIGVGLGWAGARVSAPGVAPAAPVDGAAGPALNASLPGEPSPFV